LRAPWISPIFKVVFEVEQIQIVENSIATGIYQE
jgi:hypothetical protein